MFELARFCILLPLHNITMGVFRKKMNDDVKNVWRNADAVCFDVDSTVIQSEAIDELAAFCGKADQVKAM